MIQTLIAVVRSRSSWNMLRIKREGRWRDGRSGDTEKSACGDQHHRRSRNAASTDATPNIAAPMSSSRRRPMRSPSVPAVIERAGDEKPIDVDDPEQLRAARLEIFTQLRHRQMQHREIHRVQQAGQRDDREPDPFLLACPFDFVYASFQMLLAVLTPTTNRHDRMNTRDPVAPVFKMPPRGAAELAAPRAIGVSSPVPPPPMKDSPTP